MPKQLSVLKDIYLDPEVEADLQNRLSRIEGHVRGIKRMLGEHAFTTPGVSSRFFFTTTAQASQVIPETFSSAVSSCSSVAKAVGMRVCISLAPYMGKRARAAMARVASQSRGLAQR